MSEDDVRDYVDGFLAEGLVVTDPDEALAMSTDPDDDCLIAFAVGYR